MEQAIKYALLIKALLVGIARRYFNRYFTPSKLRDSGRKERIARDMCGNLVGERPCFLYDFSGIANSSRRDFPDLTSKVRNISTAKIIAWVVYDTGNTTFFTGVLGLVFPLWITTVMGGTDATVGFTLSVAMAIVFLISPILGTVSDQVGRRMLFLIFFTILGVVATFMIGAAGIVVSLAMFAIAVVAIHTADIFYNALLEDVSSRSNVGTIAGLGIGLGYLGAIMAVVVSIFFIVPLGHVYVIRILSVIMLVLMIPLLIVGKDKTRDDLQVGTGVTRLAYESMLKLINAAKEVRRDSVWARFLVARFWYMWAVNAASSFAVLYGVQTVGLSATEVQVVLLLGIITGVPSAALWGRAVDKLGASFVLKTVVSCWLVLLIATIIIPIVGLPGFVWGGIGVLSGVFIAGLYVAERPLVMRMAPPGRVAEYFSLNSMSGRLAAIAGPFSWGFIAVTLGLGQIVAVAWLGLCVALSVVFLAKLHVGVPSQDTGS